GRVPRGGHGLPFAAGSPESTEKQVCSGLSVRRGWMHGPAPASSGQTCRGHNGSSWSQKEAAPPPKITLQTGGGQFIGNAQEQGQSCAPVEERPAANYDKEAGDHSG